MKNINVINRNKDIRILPFHIACGNVDVEADLLMHVDASFFENLAVRAGGILANRAFYLSPKYDWVLGKDDLGSMVLVPLRLDSLSTDLIMVLESLKRRSKPE